MGDHIENIIQSIKRNGIIILLIIGILVGLFFIFAESKTTDLKNKDIGTYSDDEMYSKILESKLEDIINEIHGVSNVKVMITLKSGSESVFASDGDGQNDKHVITGDGLVCVKKILPAVEGVAVVCKGGDDALVKEKITSLVCSLLGLYSNHVYVTE